MGDRQLVVGGSRWHLPDGDPTDTVKQIKQALETGALVDLELVDANGAAVLVYLNGSGTQTVEFDLGGGPRPSEISGSATFAPARLVTIGAAEWQLPAGDVTDTLNEIKRALTDGTVAQLQLLDAAGRAVTVLFNGRTVDTVGVDLGGAPRPSEISGS